LNGAAVQRRYFLKLVGCTLALRPDTALAQAGGKIPTVAYLWHAGNPGEESPYYEALIEGFAKLGYVDGRNIRLIHRFPDERPERFKAMAEELVAMKVDVLMGGAIGSAYLRDITKTIPIVFMFVPDPVSMNFAKTLARPGGNATGLSNFGRKIAVKAIAIAQRACTRTRPRRISYQSQSGDLAHLCRGDDGGGRRAWIDAADIRSSRHE